MKVARLHAVGDVRLHDEAAPIPGANEELVRVTAVGLCGSDLHWFSEGGIGDAVLAQPLVIGHELAGIIADGPRAGLRVAIDPAIPCNVCATCLRGHRNICPQVIFAGHGAQDGGLRELMAWPSHLLHPLPDGIDDADGAVLEPLGVAIHAVDLGRARVGATVGVVGCGPIGLLLLQVARAAGARTIVAADPLRHRRNAASGYGADLVLDPADASVGADPTTALADAGLHEGLDVVYEIAGTDDAVALAMALARPGARVVLGGIPDDDRTTFPAALARRRGLTIAMSRRMGEVYPRAMALVEQGRVDVRSVVSHRYGLVDVGEAFEVASRREGLKVVVHPTDPAA